METDNLVRTTTTDGSDLRYMTTGRATDTAAAERAQMADTNDENPFQNPPVNDRSAGIHSSHHITSHGVNDRINLQQDLDSLQNWSDKWLLRFNPDKCKVMHIGHDCKFLYMIKQDGKSYRLSETVQERDLGVLVQSDLKSVIPVY